MTSDAPTFFLISYISTLTSVHACVNYLNLIKIKRQQKSSQKALLCYICLCSCLICSCFMFYLLTVSPPGIQVHNLRRYRAQRADPLEAQNNVATRTESRVVRLPHHCNCWSEWSLSAIYYW